MAKETIYLTENVRLSGAEEDSPRGAEVSVNKTEADFLVDVAKVATREKPKPVAPPVDDRPLLLPEPLPSPDLPKSKDAAQAEAAAKADASGKADSAAAPAAKDTKAEQAAS